MNDVLNMIEELANERRQTKKEAYEREQAQKLAANKARYDAMMAYFRPVLHAAREACNNRWLRSHIEVKDSYSADAINTYVVITEKRTSSHKHVYFFQPKDGGVEFMSGGDAVNSGEHLSVKDALAQMIDLLAQILSTYKEV